MKQNYVDCNIIQKGNITLLQCFPMDLFLQIFTCHVTKARSFARNAVNWELSFVLTQCRSYRFNGESDNVVIEFIIIIIIIIII